MLSGIFRKPTESSGRKYLYPVYVLGGEGNNPRHSQRRNDMSLITAIDLAAAIHDSFTVDFGAAAWLGDVRADHLEALSTLRAHPARFSGRASLRRSIADAIAVLEAIA